MEFSMLLSLAGILLFFAVFGLGYVIFVRQPNLGKRIQDPQPSSSGFNWSGLAKRAESIFKPLGEMIPRSPEEMTRQEQRLQAAGIRRKDAPILLYGVKIGLAVAVFFIFLAGGYVRTNPMLFIILPVLMGALIPDMWLTRSIQKRKDRIQRALPDMLDLAVVSVEAGLGLDQSLMRISQELTPVYPDLSDELRLYSLEVNAGRKRADAFRNLGNRTGVDDLRAFVAVLIQTDRFGTSVAQSLRVFADNLRIKRRQRAEEHSAKMSIKMIPPLVVFIFPAIFVVILGPAIIAIVRQLLPGLK
jgi:tight adherence protein C